MNRNKTQVILLLVMVALGFLPGGSTGAETSQAEAVVNREGLAAPVALPSSQVRSVSAATVQVVPETVQAAPAIVQVVPETVQVAPATVRAASGATVRFKTQNGEMVDGAQAETLDLPHLVLHRNGALTDPGERTLIVEVAGIEVPPGGVTITLSVETQHGDPDLDSQLPQRIPVWRESRRMANATGITQRDMTVTLRHTFDSTVGTGAGTIATPTDYFRFDLEVAGVQQPLGGALSIFSQDYAFLMENQWVVPLPEVQEAAAGAAPDELVVYYCDMVPFRRDSHEPTTWLPRQEVPGYVRSELIPVMVEAFRIQTDVWGFPWYEEWHSYRSGSDLQRLSVALSDGQTWFHGKAPGQGNAALSINVSRGKVEYATLTEGLMSTFHHELFHNQQRNIYLYHGGSGALGGAENAWDFFAEGMAVMASSVGQPKVQLDQTWGTRAYLTQAKGFVGNAGISGGDLNKSYERMNAYHAAAYWRFLYEKCGGMKNGAEDPAAGTQVIRRTLHVLYAGEVVDASQSTDLVGKLPEIMDRALEGSSCPFRTYEDSLQALARAIFGLRLEEGRCGGPGSAGGCGFYDPQGLYPEPPYSAIAYSGGEIVYAAPDQAYPAGIPSSFGMDFVEVVLEPGADGRSLVIELHGAPGGESAFSVQVWTMKDSGDGSRPHLVSGPAGSPVFATVNLEGHLVYGFPSIDRAEFNRLGLLITRIDSKEGADSEGAYTIVLR